MQQQQPQPQRLVWALACVAALYTLSLVAMRVVLPAGRTTLRASANINTAPSNRLRKSVYRYESAASAVLPGKQQQEEEESEEEEEEEAQGQRGWLQDLQDLWHPPDGVTVNTTYISGAGSSSGSDGGHHPVTLVTSFYPLGSHSKHSEADYLSWAANFFPVVTAPVVVYLPPSSSSGGTIVDTIIEMRRDLPTTIHTVALWDLPVASRYREAFEGEQWERDPEASRHFPELYAVWDSKAWMVRQAALTNHHGSQWFFWVDAGSFRKRGFPSFPAVDKVQSFYHSSPSGHNSKSVTQDEGGGGDNKDKIVLGMVSPAALPLNELACNPEAQDLSRDWVEGGFFGGTKAAVSWWSQGFYSLLDEWMEEKRFVGKDQVMMNHLARSNLYRVSFLNAYKADECFDKWFFFQPFLSSSQDTTGGALNRHECFDVSRLVTNNVSPCGAAQVQGRLV